jgi:hypothetical protein
MWSPTRRTTFDAVVELLEEARRRLVELAGDLAEEPAVRRRPAHVDEHGRTCAHLCADAFCGWTLSVSVRGLLSVKW